MEQTHELVEAGIVNTMHYSTQINTPNQGILDDHITDRLQLEEQTRKRRESATNKSIIC